MRLEQNIKNISAIISIQGLFSADLRTLVSIQRELEDSVPQQPNIAGKMESFPRAFTDTWINTLVSDHSRGDLSDADLRVLVHDERAIPEFLVDIYPTTFEPRQEKGTEGFIRDKSTSSLLKNVIWVKDTVASLLKHVVASQEAYLVSNDVTQLRPYTINDLAEKAQLHYSTVARLLTHRTLIAPDGYLMPVKSLLATQDSIDRLAFFRRVSAEYPDLFEAPSSQCLGKMLDVSFSPRTIRKYMAFLFDRKNAVDERKIKEREEYFPDLSTLSD